MCIQFKMEKKQRLRAPNFTCSDNLLLCDIINKYKHIIENKKTDGTNLQHKQRAWVEVAKEFNSINTSYSRMLESLQQNYKNLKKKTKKHASSAKMDIPVDRATLVENIEVHGTSSEGWKNVADSTGASAEVCQDIFTALSKQANKQEKQFKKNIMGTGGGPPPKCDDDPLLEKVRSLVGPTIDGIYTVYDGDSDLMASQNVIPIELQNMEDSNVFNTGEGPTQQTNLEDETSKLDYFTNDRANLKKSPHRLLTRKRQLEPHGSNKQTVAEKFKTLASEKMELVALQKELLSIQIAEEKEKQEHNRLLRTMEIEETQKKYEHNEVLRKLELEKLSQ